MIDNNPKADPTLIMLIRQSMKFLNWRGLVGASQIPRRFIVPVCNQCGGDILPEHIVTVPGCEEICYPCYKTHKPNVCVDFDGVLAQYDGWKGPEHLGEPNRGALAFVKKLSETFAVIIHSTRHPQDIERWCKEHGFIDYITHITDTKMPAVCYVDDRAVQFSGNFAQTIVEVEYFKPYWKELSYGGETK